MAASFDFDSILAEARERAGSSDFGSDFEEPLRRLLRSLEDEADLNETGRAMQRERTVNVLATRARVESWFHRHPEIADEHIGAPLVVCGLPRTGTTMLHRVIAEDPEFDSAKWYETRFPAPFDGWEPCAPDAPDERIAVAKEEVRMTLELAPELMAIHPFDATSPDEEIMLLEQSFYSAVPDSYCRLPSYAEWVDAQDQMPGYRYLLRMLQFLQWQHRQRGGVRPRWTLKSPHHLHYLRELFTLFPDATVVQTHREPEQIVPSICSMSKYLFAMGTDRPDLHWVGAHWSAKWARAMERSMRYRDAAIAADPRMAERFIDVWFLDSVKDPVETVRSVYARIGRELTAVAREKMERWTEDNAREKRAPHAYSLEEFGLTSERIRELYGAYRERYILTRAGARE
ncbi:MAG: sulfotransferase [Myxococcota bacterium]